MVRYDDLVKYSAIFEESEVVAFDVFDTILYRKVSPMHVHRIWAKSLIEKLGLKLTVDELVKLKFECGRLAKLKNIIYGNDREYRYKQMSNLLKRKLMLNMDNNVFYSICVEFELNAEKQVSYIPDEVKKTIERIKVEKQVICISDYYLPGNILKQILHSKGVEIDLVFVSSDYLLQKRTSRLYDVVVQRMKIEPGKILMVGDTKSSDYDQALKAGLRAIYVENSERKEYYDRFEKTLQMAKEEYGEYMRSEKVRMRTLPFSHVSFLMYIFISRLYKELINDGCSDVLFMSREGELFKKLFDEYQIIVASEKERIRTHYFYVSRKATIIPSIHVVDKEAFREIFKNYPAMSLRTFLKNLGLDSNKHVLDSLADFDLDIEVENFQNSREFEYLLNNSKFVDECLKKAYIQRNLLEKYLDDMKINYRENGLFLVDVGYSGTSQNNIFRAFKGNISIFGYYMISYAEKESICKNNKKKGIIFDTLASDKKDILTYNSAVIEMLSLASHCGVDSYKLVGTEVRPVFHDNEKELICYREIISPLQATIIEEFKKISTLINDAYLDENFYYKKFRHQYKRFIYNPTKEEMDRYLTIPFVDNFAAYREYIPETKIYNHKWFSINGLRLLISTKGRCLKEQNTHWIAAALYKIDMRIINPCFYVFSKIAMNMFDIMVKITKKQKGL